MQLVIKEGEDPEEIPVFKSNIFWLIVNSSINAEIEQPKEYDQWIDIANAKLNELDVAIDEANTLDIEAEKVDTTTTITITKKDGTEESVNILDGEAGQDGADAKINGVNTLTLEAGDNITLEQEGSTLTINSTGGGGGTGDYTDLTNKPKINNVELTGNKTTSDLGIVIPDVSNFITKDANDLTYYTKTNDLSSVATSGSYNDLSNKPDLSTKQDKIDSTHKLDADLVDDTNSTNKFVSASDKTTWNGKQDTLTAGDNITIENNVISASGGGSTYFLTTPFTTATASTSLNADDIATLNKAIDDFRAGKDFVLIAKKMMFKISGSSTNYSYNVNGIMRESGRYIYIDFYRNFGAGTSAWPINFDDTGLIRTISLRDVGTPANITSASLPAQGTPSFSDNIVTIGNTTAYNVINDYNPAHKKYVDDSVAIKQDIMQYETLPTASASNEGQIVQYIGTTTNDYTQGYFYQVISDGEETPTYSWENIEVQASSGGEGKDLFFWDGTGGLTDNNRAIFQPIYDRWKEGKSSTLYIKVRSNNLYVPARIDYTDISLNLYILFNEGLNRISFASAGNVRFTNGILSYVNAFYYQNVINKKIPNEYNTNASEYSEYSVLGTNNTKAYTPTADYNPSTKKYVDDKPTTYSGYDATKTQVLKNINGTLTWVDE